MLMNHLMDWKLWMSQDLVAVHGTLSQNWAEGVTALETSEHQEDAQEVFDEMPPPQTVNSNNGSKASTQQLRNPQDKPLLVQTQSSNPRPQDASVTLGTTDSYDPSSFVNWGSLWTLFGRRVRGGNGCKVGDDNGSL